MKSNLAYPHNSPTSLPFSSGITRISVFFFFQAEDGIRDLTVTGVQTCALPISAHSTPAFTGDSAKVNTVAYHSVPVISRVIGPPTGPSVAGSCSVRSGLMACQLPPPSVVLHTFWAVA